MKDEEPNSSNSSQGSENKKTLTIKSVTVQAMKKTPITASLVEGVASVSIANTSAAKTPTEQLEKPTLSVSVSVNQSAQVEVKPLPIDYPNSYQPAIVHANFNPHRVVIDPERSLTDIPEPAIRFSKNVSELYGKPDQKNNEDGETINNSKNIKNTWHTDKKTIDNCWNKTDSEISQWDLIKSSALAEHIQLLQAGELAKFPKSFYKNIKKQQPLLSSLSNMEMVAMSDIRAVLKKHPSLKRDGFDNSSTTIGQKHTSELDSHVKSNIQKLKQEHKSSNLLIENYDYADDWEVILYPHRFDASDELFYTDIMACSIAKHALQQCTQRKTINTKLSIHDITNVIRSYQLSQCKELPAMREQLRRTGIYEGHIIIASILLELEMHVDNIDAEADIDATIRVSEINIGMINKNVSNVHLNISSRSALFTRYPILSNYYINGWQ